MVIDFHMHVFPDALAERALGVLSEKADLSPYTSGMVEETKQKMKEWGVDKGVFLNIATNSRQQKKVNDFAIACRDESIIPFGSVYPFADDALDELERIHALGLKGIKLHPEYQEFAPDDERVYPIYSKCDELGLVVLFHAGKDLGYPDSLKAPPRSIRAVADAHPNLKIVAAHLGGFLCWEDVYTYLCGSSVYLDTSFLEGYLNPDLAKKIIRAHGADKVLFGSDCPWMDSKSCLDYLENLHLEPEEMDNILYKNASRLLEISCNAV